MSQAGIWGTGDKSNKSSECEEQRAGQVAGWPGMNKGAVGRGEVRGVTGDQMEGARGGPREYFDLYSEQRGDSSPAGP